jgi:hypothetical protein
MREQGKVSCEVGSRRLRSGAYLSNTPAEAERGGSAESEGEDVDGGTTAATMNGVGGCESEERARYRGRYSTSQVAGVDSSRALSRSRAGPGSSHITPHHTPRQASIPYRGSGCIGHVPCNHRPWTIPPDVLLLERRSCCAA